MITMTDIKKAILHNDQILELIAKELNISQEELRKQLDTPAKVSLFTDGGSRGNPGESGVGIIINDGKSKTGYYYYTGIKTNNEAEYIALIKGLEISADLKYKAVEVFADSELMCRQINGIYKVSNPGLKILYQEAVKLIGRFQQFTISHIPRAKNQDADKMANLAMDKKNNGQVELTAAE